MSSYPVVASKGNLLLQYVILGCWTFRLEYGENGGLIEGVVPRMHSISGHIHTGHLQHGREQEHGRSHDSKAFSGVHSLSFPTFMSMKHLAVGCASNVLAARPQDFSTPLCIHSDSDPTKFEKQRQEYLDIRYKSLSRIYYVS